MEIIKEFILCFITFGVLDSLMFNYYLRNIGKCKKLNLFYILFGIGFVLTLFKFIIPFGFYQIVAILYLIIFINITNNIKFNDCVKIIISMFIFLLISEMSYTYLFEILGLEIYKFNAINLYIYFLPNKIINLLLIKEISKWDLLGLQKLQKKSSKN